jgi:FkbM family methyltransferase
MYKTNRGLREWTLDINTFIPEFVNKCSKWNINHSDVKFYSQQDEDKYIIQYILKDKIHDGTFIELGAYDGIAYSNTKVLEEYFGFTGILVEPVKKLYDALIKNRPKSKCYNCAISNKDTDLIDYIGYNGCAGIKETIAPGSKKYLPEKDINNSYKVKNKTLSEIIKHSKLKYIDIISLDVEGGELEVLKSIDFNIPIFCIIIEAHSDEQEKNKIFGNYLKQQGFTFKERQRGNEIWFNHNYFRKHLFNV